MRYVVTERLLADTPTVHDPKATIVKRYTGVFDIRDVESGGVICATAWNLKVARATQAKWNSDQLGQWVN